MLNENINLAQNTTTDILRFNLFNNLCIDANRYLNNVDIITKISASNENNLIDNL